MLSPLVFEWVIGRIVGKAEKLMTSASEEGILTNRSYLIDGDTTCCRPQ